MIPPTIAILKPENILILIIERYTPNIKVGIEDKRRKNVAILTTYGDD